MGFKCGGCGARSETMIYHVCKAKPKTATSADEAVKPTPLPCPFCGKSPKVIPTNPKMDGNAWGAVVCANKRCFAQPMVKDGSWLADDRGSDVYKAQAVRRWNRRVTQPPAVPASPAP